MADAGQQLEVRHLAQQHRRTGGGGGLRTLHGCDGSAAGL